MSTNVSKAAKNLLEQRLEEVLKNSDQMVLFDHYWAHEQTDQAAETIERICSDTALDVFKIDAADLTSELLLKTLAEDDIQHPDQFSNSRKLSDEIERKQSGIIVVTRAQYLTGKKAHILTRLARYSSRNKLNWKVILIGKTAEIEGIVIAQLALDHSYPENLIKTSRQDTLEQQSELEASQNPSYLIRYVGLGLLFLLPLVGFLIYSFSSHVSITSKTELTITTVNKIEVQAQTINSPEQYGDDNYSGFSLDEIYDAKAHGLEFQEKLDAISQKPETESNTLTASRQNQFSLNSQPGNTRVKKTPLSTVVRTLAPSMSVEFYNAIKSDKLSDIQAMVNDGQPLNAINQNGESALIISITEGLDSLANWLLTQSIDVNQVDKQGRSALFYATVANNTSVISRLIKLGGDPNLSSRLRKTPLMIAVHNDYKVAAELLIAAGASVNKTDHSGWSALFYSVWNNNKSITDLLLVQGANPLQKDSNGNTPVDIAKSRPGNQLLESLSSTTN